jgi:hypothetical protein
MMTILTTSSLGGADVVPIGGSITGATESIRIHKTLHQPNPVAILALPILR